MTGAGSGSASAAAPSAAAGAAAAARARATRAGRSSSGVGVSRRKCPCAPCAGISSRARPRVEREQRPAAVGPQRLVAGEGGVGRHALVELDEQRVLHFVAQG